jgi:hypothetical protein
VLVGLNHENMFSKKEKEVISRIERELMKRWQISKEDVFPHIGPV